MTLHLAFTSDGLTAARRVEVEGDAIILLGDAVYALVTDSSLAPKVLAEDAEVRGLDASSGLSYSDLAALCAKHQPIVSWND